MNRFFEKMTPTRLFVEAASMLEAFLACMVLTSRFLGWVVAWGVRVAAGTRHVVPEERRLALCLRPVVSRSFRGLRRPTRAEQLECTRSYCRTV